MDGSDSGIASFGPFTLSPSARSLEREGVSVVLGGRALDILIVLVERAGQVVSHKELIARVWRGLVVDPGNLRVHMTGLRKALGEGRGTPRYIANVPGQGYCFVAQVRRETPTAQNTQTPDYQRDATGRRLVLPPALARMVGRDEAVRAIVSDLIADRFVSIIGPGGMGKTTVAVRVAHAMVEEFGGAVCFVDISSVAEPGLVAATIASTLGLTVQNQDVVSALLQCLQTLRVLLILDNCEHVIDATATLAERIFQHAPGVHILATSREALRAEGEHAYWLPPLPSPPPTIDIRAADALAFPAVKLFMDRVAASGSRFELRDADAAMVADICGRLDGIALAIEIVAARVGAYGIEATARLLDKRLGLHWPGRRTAPSRHRTLQALLDWSYASLEDSERRMLRRLSILVGTFTMEAAQAIACERALDKSRAIDTVDSLVAKSLVSAVNSATGVTRYRLLETTRAYALERLDESGETQTVAHGHAKYFASLLHGEGRTISPVEGDCESTLSSHLLGNVREALEWCFGGNEANPAEPGTRSSSCDPTLGIGLAAGAMPILMGLSLLNECQKWSAMALTMLADTERGTLQEMVLQEARAISSTWALGDNDGARAAITRALEIARSLGERSRRLRLLVAMHVFLIRIGDIGTSLAVAEEFDSTAREDMDTSYSVMSDWLLGSSHHFKGNQAEALRHFQRSFERATPLNLKVFGLDYRVRALVTFDRALWLSGSPDRALEVAQEAIHEAETLGSALNVCFSLLYTAPVFLWCGDHSAAKDVLDKLMAHPNWYALPSVHATAHALKGELLVRTGKVQCGIQLLCSALVTMRGERQTLFLARASCVYAEGLNIIGQHQEAFTVISDAIVEAVDGSETTHLPELLRIQADILLALPEKDESKAESCLMQALTVAREQSALAWELRISMTLARVRARQGRVDEARHLLSSAYRRFTEGFETADLQAARRALEDLRQPNVFQSSAVGPQTHELDAMDRRFV
jgi:predicted ATPase/DNA-binding winged helix-turn-helix (wHTH) protein